MVVGLGVELGAALGVVVRLPSLPTGRSEEEHDRGNRVSHVLHVLLVTKT